MQVFFAICLDESVDINDVAQLIICVKTVDINFEIHEEMLSLVGLHSNVNGIDAVMEEVFSFADKSKLCSVCTGGASTMVGEKMILWEFC